MQEVITMKKTALALALCLVIALCCACDMTPLRSDVPETKSTPDDTVPASTVTFDVNGREYSVKVLDSWDAQPVTLDDGQWGLTLTPKAQPKLKYYLEFYKQEQVFGVCGTGLEEEETVIGGMEANVGYYDGADYWSFVSFDCGGMSGSLSWGIDEGDARQLGISEYNAQAMTMLESLAAN